MLELREEKDICLWLLRELPVASTSSRHRSAGINNCLGTMTMKMRLLFSEQMKGFMKATQIDDNRSTVTSEVRRSVQRDLRFRQHGEDEVASVATSAGTSSTLNTNRIKGGSLSVSLESKRRERQRCVQRQTAHVKRMKCSLIAKIQDIITLLLVFSI